MKRVVVKNTFKFSLFLIVLFLITLTFVFSFTNVNTVFSKNDVDYIYYEVDNNDTLWDIAENYCDKGDNIRMFIYNIEKDNNIKNNIIHVGQILRISI